MKKIMKPIMRRRDFLKWSCGVTAAAASFPLLPGEFVHADAMAQVPTQGPRRTLQALHDGHWQVTPVPSSRVTRFWKAKEIRKIGVLKN